MLKRFLYLFYLGSILSSSHFDQNSGRRSLQFCADAQYLSRAQCNAFQMPVVLLYKDPETGNFTIVQRLGLNDSTSSVANVLDSIPGATPNQFRMLTADDYKRSDNDGDGGFWNTLGATESLLASRHDGDGLDSQGGPSRTLRVLDDMSTTVSNQTTNNSTGNTTNSNITNNLYYARECGCFEPRNPVTYCPFTIDACLIHIEPGKLPGCRSLVDSSSFAYLFQIVCLGWFGILVLCLVLPLGTGAFFRDYLLSFCYPKWTEKVADRILRNNPGRARGLIRTHLIRRQMMIERSIFRATAATNAAGERNTDDDNNNNNNNNNSHNNGSAVVLPVADMELIGSVRLQQQPEQQHTLPQPPKPTSLVLRTRTYRSSYENIPSQEKKLTLSVDSADDNEEKEQERHADCAICFSLLKDGDRVGELRCQHIFHSSCLKQWLTRKNVCPLCQIRDIAEPRYNEEDVEESGDTK